MERKRLAYLGLSMAIILALGGFLFGNIQVSKAADADRSGSSSNQLLPAEAIDVTVVFTDTGNPIVLSDLSENVIAEGVHTGSMKCVLESCGQKTHLVFTESPTNHVEIDYKFTSLLAKDDSAGRVLVAGNGKIESLGMKERFQFTAAIQDQGDGTLSVTYVASRPEASFVLQAPGWIQIQP